VYSLSLADFRWSYEVSLATLTDNPVRSGRASPRRAHFFGWAGEAPSSGATPSALLFDLGFVFFRPTHFLSIPFFWFWCQFSMIPFNQCFNPRTKFFFRLSSCKFSIFSVKNPPRMNTLRKSSLSTTPRRRYYRHVFEYYSPPPTPHPFFFFFFFFFWRRQSYFSIQGTYLDCPFFLTSHAVTVTFFHFR